MVWLLFVAVILVVVVRVASRRRAVFEISRSESISTVHLERSRRHDAKTKAALDAATSSLR